MKREQIVRKTIYPLIRHKKVIFAFLIGFLFWLPFLHVVLEASPYKLVIYEDSVGQMFDGYIPDWGWELKPEERPNFIEGHFIEGSYQGIWILIIEYVIFFLCTLLAYYFVVEIIPNIEDLEKLKIEEKIIEN